MLSQTLTNVRTTQKTDAASSVTTSSEGTGAPVATVTTWARTNILAPVQINSKSYQYYGVTRQKQRRHIEEDVTKLKHEVRRKK